MVLLLKSSYILTYGSHFPVEDAPRFISLHLGLLPIQGMSPCICFIRRDSAVKMDDETFFKVRKYFPIIDTFFQMENYAFESITANQIIIRANTTINGVADKLILIEEYDLAKTLQNTVHMNMYEWEQLVHLRDVLCLKLTLLRKYSIYGRLVFDRLVNHLAIIESNESNIFQLPMNMINDHPYLKLNFSQFDMQTCQLLDAEIRAFLRDKIIICSKILRETKPITFGSFYPFV